MRKLLLSFLFTGLVMCQGLAAKQSNSSTATVKGPGEPFERYTAAVKVKRAGIYQVNYSTHIVQKGITDTHAALGIILRQKSTNQSKFYRTKPTVYSIDDHSKNKTFSHASGHITLNLLKGDVLELGLVKNTSLSEGLGTRLAQAHLVLVPRN